MAKLKFGDNADVIFTTYFTSKPNPQPNEAGVHVHTPKDQFAYIFPWYASVSHLGLNAVVIHDGLSAEFISKYETDKIQFVHYLPQKYSLNDERFFALEEILDHNQLGKVLLTDGSDVLVKKNPFDFMSDPALLYFGTDEEKRPHIRDNPWCLTKLRLLQQGKAVALDETVLDFQYINAGVYGGSYANIKEFNQALTLLFRSLDNNNNNNMMAINYLLWKFAIPHFKGRPFTSRFKRYEMHGDYYIVHK